MTLERRKGAKLNAKNRAHLAAAESHLKAIADDAGLDLDPQGDLGSGQDGDMTAGTRNAPMIRTVVPWLDITGTEYR